MKYQVIEFLFAVIGLWTVLGYLADMIFARRGRAPGVKHLPPPLKDSRSSLVRFSETHKR